MANSSFLNWKWQNQHVGGNTLDGRHIVPDSTIVLAGPALLSQFSARNEIGLTSATTGGNEGEYKGLLFPIGSLLTFNSAQMRANQPTFEIGAKRAYIIPGKINYSLDIQGFTLYGPSLMRQLYALQPNPELSGGNATGMMPMQSASLNTSALGDKYNEWFPDAYGMNAGFGLRPSEDDRKKKRNRDFYIALASELFNVPIGLCVILRNSQSGGYGGFYLEECMIDTHNMGIAATETVLIETVRVTYSQLVPVEVSDGLVTL